MLISDIYHKHPKTIGPDTTIARAVEIAGLASRDGDVRDTMGSVHTMKTPVKGKPARADDNHDLSLIAPVFVC